MFSAWSLFPVKIRTCRHDPFATKNFFYRAARYETGTAKIYFVSAIISLLLLTAAILSFFFLRDILMGSFTIWNSLCGWSSIKEDIYRPPNIESAPSNQIVQEKKTNSKQVTRKSGHLNQLYYLYVSHVSLVPQKYLTK